MQNSDTVPYSRLMCSKNPMAGMEGQRLRVGQREKILTVQGMPLVGVKTGGNLRDGEEIVLVDLPLKARLLKVILRSDKNRLDYRYFDN